MTYKLQKEIGNIKRLELPSIGETFEANQRMGSVETNKAECILYSPFDNKIQKVKKYVYDKFKSLYYLFSSINLCFSIC